MPLETSGLTLGEPTVSGKGSKQIPLKDRDGLLTWRPEALRVLWQPKAFNDPEAGRVPICFQTTPEVEAYMQTLDDWVLKALAADPRKYLGQDMTPEQLQERYASAMKTSSKGYLHLKAKMNLAGRAAVKCWDAETKKPRKAPEDWTVCEVKPCFEIRGLWQMGKDFGLLVELTDALISESAASCPF